MCRPAKEPGRFLAGTPLRPIAPPPLRRTRGIGRSLAGLGVCVLALLLTGCAPDSPLRGWEAIGPDNALILTIAAESGPAILLAGGEGGVFIRDGWFGGWRRPAGRHAAPDTVTSLAEDPREPGRFVVLASNTWFALRRPAGEWVPLTTNLPVGTVATHLVSGADAFWTATDRGVFRSEDGTTWEARSAGLPAGVYTVAASSGDPNRLVAGTLGQGIYFTQDGGKSWQAAVAGVPANSAILALSADPADPNRFVAGGEPAIYESIDGGAAWRELPQPAGARVRGLAIRGGDQPGLYAATEVGMFWLPDTAARWEDISRGLPLETTVVDLQLVGPDRLYAAAGQVFEHRLRIPWLPIVTGLVALISGLAYWWESRRAAPDAAHRRPGPPN